MPASTRIITAIAAALLMVAAPASADTQTIEMTGPYESGTYSTTCGETGHCGNAAFSRVSDGHLTVKVEVAGVHGGPGSSEPTMSTAEATVTARHAVPDLGEDTEVASIRYTAEMRRDQVYLAGVVGLIEYSFGAAHSSGVELEGADERSLAYAGGVVIAIEDGTATLTLEVMGVDGAAIPPGDMDVTVGLHALLTGSHATHCEMGTCISAGAGAGIIDTALYVDRITAELTTRPAA